MAGLELGKGYETKREGWASLSSLVYSNYGYQLGSERGVNVNTIIEMLNSA